MNVAVALTAFILILPVELPDKTFIATLVLATRYRPLLVWIGVSAAFLVQTAIAVTLGGVLGRLPRTPVEVFAGLMFLVGAILLLHRAGDADFPHEETEHEYEDRTHAGLHGWRASGASFVVLFLAEWGDLSQLLTAGLVVKYHEPLSVGVGAWAALVCVSGLAALAGRSLLKWVRLSRLRRVGGVLCLLLAVLTGLQVAGVHLPGLG